VAGFSSSGRQWSHTSRSRLPREREPTVAQHRLVLGTGDGRGCNSQSIIPGPPSLIGILPSEVRRP
jgi:hypothetical protein